MKTVIKLTLITILFFMSFQSYAQVADSTYYKRLFYTCKAWGYVKYYHTEVAKGNVNWDDALLDALDAIKNAPDNASFNTTLMEMLNKAGDMETSSADLPSIPDSLNNNKDYTWIENPIFSTSVKENLNAIKIKFRPQDHFYVNQPWVGGNPTFKNDNAYSSNTEELNEKTKILAIFRYWNIIHYFFPYKDIMDQHWDASLTEFIPQIIETSTLLDYTLTFKRFTTKINDSHAFFTAPVYDYWKGRAYPPFLVRFIENEMVITQVLPNVNEIKVGDIIKKWNGEDINLLRDSLRKYAHGSNDVIIERELNSIIMSGDFVPFTITVDNGTTIDEESLTRNSTNFAKLNTNTNPAWSKVTLEQNCTIGIVDMGKLKEEEVRSMFNDLGETKAIIFDIRNYPNGTLWEIVNYIYRTPINIANFTTPDITYPGRLVWQSEIIGNGTSKPYSGKIILLFDERTQSHAEYTVMGLEQFPHAIKIGSTTAGADGNVSRISLPGQIFTYGTFLGTYYPDYTPTQRVGIIPDFEVHPTIAGIREGRDELMEFALNTITNCNIVNGLEQNNFDTNFKLYPNPTSGEVYYDLGNVESSIFEIFDTQGRKIKTVNINSSTGKIDISELRTGAYFIKIIGDKNVQIRLIIEE